MCKQFHEIENHAKQSGIQNVCIIRGGALQNCLYWWAPMIVKERVLRMPLKANEAKWAPLNLCDLTMYAKKGFK
jgi:hypothetical protein